MSSSPESCKPDRSRVLTSSVRDRSSCSRPHVTALGSASRLECLETPAFALGQETRALHGAPLGQHRRIISPSCTDDRSHCIGHRLTSTRDDLGQILERRRTFRLGLRVRCLSSRCFSDEPPRHAYHRRSRIGPPPRVCGFARRCA